VRVPASNAGAARARLAAALPEAQVTPADAASGEGDGGPSLVAIAGSIMGVLLILFVLTSFAFRPFMAPQSSVPPQAVPMGKPIWVASVTQGSFPTETTGGAYVRTEGALTFNFKESGAATVTFPEFAAPFIAVAVISTTPASDGMLLWRVRAVGDQSVALRVNVTGHSAELVYQDQASGLTEVLGHTVALRDFSDGGPMELTVLVRTPGYVVFVDGRPMIEVTESRLDTTSSALTMTAMGTTGMIALIELRVHEAP
jgi:hypothetical protein